jgi:biotin transport system substrate-specific component
VPIRLGERAAPWQRHLLMIGTGALLIILGARISFYLPGNLFVPVTLQTFGVLFGGALLGFRRGLAAVALYMLLGVIGLPVFAWDAATESYRSGIGTIVAFRDGVVVLGSTGGYLLGFLVAGGIVGRLAEFGWDRRLGGSIAAMLIGSAAIYALGVPWLIASTGLSLEMALHFGLTPFLVGDLVKLIVAAGLLPAGWWLVRRRSTDL